MRLVSTRRPGTGTAFVDATNEEVLLQFSTDQDGAIHIAYHLYDATGALAGEASGAKPVKGGFTVACSKGETLLAVPADPEDHIHYRLYNADGLLLTFSDGIKTRIFRSLRVEARQLAAPAK